MIVFLSLSPFFPFFPCFLPSCQVNFIQKREFTGCNILNCCGVRSSCELFDVTYGGNGFFLLLLFVFLERERGFFACYDRLGSGRFVAPFVYHS